jgi:hypothetical protein
MVQNNDLEKLARRLLESFKADPAKRWPASDVARNRGSRKPRCGQCRQLTGNDRTRRRVTFNMRRRATLNLDTETCKGGVVNRS